MAGKLKSHDTAWKIVPTDSGVFLERGTSDYPKKKAKRQTRNSTLQQQPTAKRNRTVTLTAAAAKALQSCPALRDPMDGSPPGSPLGFSRQEHWSGLPFPSPMQESEKWKGSHSVVSDSSWPHGLQPIRLLRPWDFPGKSTGVGCHCLLR